MRRPEPSFRRYRAALGQILVEGSSPTSEAIRAELKQALGAMLGNAPASPATLTARALVVGTPSNSPAIRALGWQAELTKLGPEGFIIRTAQVQKQRAIVVASDGEIGALYGAFHLLRLLQTGQPIEQLNVAERPRVQLRMLNHWDNLNGTIERGYAGRSLWQWNELPGKVSPRYADYARANASIGINGAVINNVNADAARPDRRSICRRSPRWRTCWRPYGVRMYLSANFAAPIASAD